VQEAVPALRTVTCLDIGRLIQRDEQTWRPPDITGASLAMLQYTSGSTAEPRGVMLPHATLLANAAMIHAASGHREGDVAVFWLPPFHDMGLLGGVVQPVYADVPTIVMAPTTFLQRPARWLEAMSRYRATTTGAPNFAYDLCVQRVSPRERAALDLSAWRTAFNGAELVRAPTLAGFVQSFAPAGLRADVFVPCYGLAEATLLVAAERVEAPTLSTGVTVGPPIPPLDVRIVDPATEVELAAGEVGEIWVHGPSVAAGYWGRADATRLAFDAHLPGDARAWLRTGDLGAMERGRLQVSGRLKDLVILHGRNFYPHDIEQVAERSHAALRAGFSCAFSVRGATAEELVYVAEVVRQHRPSDDDAVVRAIRAALATELGIVPAAITLVRSHSIARTSSGKLRRGACRTAYLTGARGGRRLARADERSRDRGRDPRRLRRRLARQRTQRGSAHLGPRHARA
jgi:acyl-CoA synthetase (AMP-forming)/AMP-acid ligase II